MALSLSSEGCALQQKNTYKILVSVMSGSFNMIAFQINFKRKKGVTAVMGVCRGGRCISSNA